MFCFRTFNSMIKKLHEEAMRAVLDDHTSDFKTFWQKNNDSCNHHRNIQTLFIEIFKSKNDLAPLIMGSMFKRRKIPLTTSENFKSLGHKEKNCILWFRNIELPFSEFMVLQLEYMRLINSLGQFKRILKQCVCNT